jgi:hypothetical protein
MKRWWTILKTPITDDELHEAAWNLIDEDECTSVWGELPYIDEMMTFEEVCNALAIYQRAKQIRRWLKKYRPEYLEELWREHFESIDRVLEKYAK